MEHVKIICFQKMPYTNRISITKKAIGTLHKVVNNAIIVMMNSICMKMIKLKMNNRNHY